MANLNELKKPFQKIQWKINHTYNNTGYCVAYIDARQVMDRLDKVVGPENWQDHYAVVGDKFLCGISINTENGWVTKWDTGDNTEGSKGQLSDSFKRAAIKWGIGRFLYDLERKKIAVQKDNKPVDNQGNRIYDLTAHFNTQNSNDSYQKPASEITWLTEEQLKTTLQSTKKQAKAVLANYSTPTHKMKREYRERIENYINSFDHYAKDSN